VLLADDVPLVTLTGPGGVGKTRLALQVAAEVAPHFADGVSFVDLGAVRDSDFVLPTIARDLDLSEQGHRPPIETLVAYLHPRHVLLVLDNLEQVVDAGPSLAHLLLHCPHLTVLATSRVVLHLSVEHDVPVEPLTTPHATQLFVTRAKAASPSFALTAQNAAIVAAICRRLDGLPLALELAAARIPALPPAALLARLDHALPLLTAGSRDQPDRLQTMRGAIAWSYDLLDDALQRFFHRLSVFVGGFGLEAAESICGQLTYGRAGTDPAARRQNASPDALGVSLLDGIISLVEKSLLREVGGPLAPQPRYQMFETIREFGAELLAASGEERAVRAAHAAQVLSWTEPARDHLFAPGYERVVERIELELGNVRASLTWAEEVGEDELGLRLARSMSHFWAVRGYYREGRQWLTRALAQGEAVPTPVRVRALLAAGYLARSQDDTEAAESLITEALTAARTIGNDDDTAVALQALGQVAAYRGDFDRAAEWTEAALALSQQVETTRIAGRQFVSLLYANLGQIALGQERFDEAAHYLDEALRRQRELGFGWGVGDTLRSVGDLHRVREDVESALVAYREGVELALDHGDRRFLAEALAGIGSLYVVPEPATAARLYGAAAALHEDIGAPVERWERPAHESRVAAVRAALPPEEFAAAWTSWHELSFESLIADVLAATNPSRAITPARSPSTQTSGNRLTAREREVLHLLTEGRTDREIGKALFISTRTVNYHVTNLLTKLDLDSRTAAAAFAVRHGLA